CGPPPHPEATAGSPRRGAGQEGSRGAPVPAPRVDHAQQDLGFPAAWLGPAPRGPARPEAHRAGMLLRTRGPLRAGAAAGMDLVTLRDHMVDDVRHRSGSESERVLELRRGLVEAGDVVSVVTAEPPSADHKAQVI